MAIVNTHYGFCARGGVLPEFTYTGEYNIREDGVVELLTSGTITFLNPAVIDIFCVGGGSGGNGGSTKTSLMGGGGSGGYTATIRKQSVSGSYDVSIGAGGAGGQSLSTSSPNVLGAAGGATSFGNILSANGGNGGSVNKNGNSGGSGGGGSVDSSSDYGAGGSDGNGGEYGYPVNITGGAGQGATTREFGETNGKLYAGGGGGSRSMAGNAPIVSPGGEGGGGAGSWSGSRIDQMQAPTAGGRNTGSGGGGGFYANNSKKANGGSGGSGIACFREAQELPELAGTWVLNKRLYPSQTGAAINESIKFTAVTPNGNFTGAKIAVGYTDTSTVGFYLNQSTTFAVYQFKNNQWVDSTRAVSQITFPIDATASDNFRAWLASNATKQS